MKKCIVCLVLVLLASPAWATVTITCAPGPGDCNVTISYVSDEAIPIRGFGLDVDTGDANVVAVQCVNPDFYVYPGSISIDASGTVTDWGLCVCSGYAGTQSGLGEPNVTIEMVSNYVGEANEPGDSGTLAIITLECTDLVSVTENTILGGVVLEDPNLDPAMDLTGASATPTGCPPCDGEVFCTLASECGGHAFGDGTCNGSIDLADLFALKTSFGASGPPWVSPKCCSDYNNSGMVALDDLFILKANFGTSGYLPSTGNQLCP